VSAVDAYIECLLATSMHYCYAVVYVRTEELQLLGTMMVRVCQCTCDFQQGAVTPVSSASSGSSTNSSSTHTATATSTTNTTIAQATAAPHGTIPVSSTNYTRM
jgi:hypothetical protein